MRFYTLMPQVLIVGALSTMMFFARAEVPAHSSTAKQLGYQYVTHVTAAKTAALIWKSGALLRKSEITGVSPGTVFDAGSDVPEDVVYMELISPARQGLNLDVYMGDGWTEGGRNFTETVPVVIVSPLELLDRNDYYANIGWDYGRISQETYTEDKIPSFFADFLDFSKKVPTSGNELCFRNRIPIESNFQIWVPIGGKEKMLQILRSNGVNVTEQVDQQVKEKAVF